MRGASLTITLAAALVGLASPTTLAAKEKTVTSSESTGTPAEPAPAPVSGPPRPMPDKPPKDAAGALVRASAAYQYGDMNQVVESARPVAEGSLPSTPEEQIQAFRLLGIGLYLTNRPLGAETAFAELLRKDPNARLDPTTTRPELVAFFESLRHRRIARSRKLYWNFLPPLGQFQNGDSTKGWVILGVGVLSLATATTSTVLLNSWEQTGYTYGSHQRIARPLRTVNWIAVGALAATYIYGLFDGMVGYSKPLEEGEPPLSLRLLPGGGGLGFTF